MTYFSTNRQERDLSRNYDAIQIQLTQKAPY